MKREIWLWLFYCAVTPTNASQVIECQHHHTSRSVRHITGFWDEWYFDLSGWYHSLWATATRRKKLVSFPLLRVQFSDRILQFSRYQIFLLLPSQYWKMPGFQYHSIMFGFLVQCRLTDLVQDIVVRQLSLNAFTRACTPKVSVWCTKPLRGSFFSVFPTSLRFKIYFLYCVIFLNFFSR